MKEELGLTHIYSGDGKGKTSASLGIVLRAAGCDLKVVFSQFLKDGKSSEIKVLETIPQVKVITGKGVTGFVKNMSEEEIAIVNKNHNDILNKVIDLCNNGQCDVLVLDEIIATVNLGLVDYDRLIDFLKNRPKNIEVIMTGRDPKQELIDLSDYISEVRKIRHPFDKGIPARFGVDK